MTNYLQHSDNTIRKMTIIVKKYPKYHNYPDSYLQVSIAIKTPQMALMIQCLTQITRLVTHDLKAGSF